MSAAEETPVHLASKISRKKPSNLLLRYAIEIIEIGPGKVLSSMIKRINSSVKISAINNEEDINNLKLI